jgi:predicted phage-related endonuclease
MTTTKSASRLSASLGKLDLTPALTDEITQIVVQYVAESFQERAEELVKQEINRLKSGAAPVPRMDAMTREGFMSQINQQVDQALNDGMSAVGTDEFLEETILNELEHNQLPESTSSVLVSLLVVFGMRRRQFLAEHPAH